MIYGHRRDPQGYHDAVQVIDSFIPGLREVLNEGDVIAVTGDHGCDPTWHGSDHTREHIPVLVCGAGIEPGSLGRRESFADIGQSLASYFGLEPMEYGTSFL